MAIFFLTSGVSVITGSTSIITVPAMFQFGIDSRVAVEVLAGGVTILNRVSVSIGAGAPTVLIGANGSGKTTFLRAAMGFMGLVHGEPSTKH
jgi:ABC-type multidrug transport system ATPase subunit